MNRNNGNYLLSGGELWTQKLYIGVDNGSRGLFRQTSGITTAREDVYVGVEPGSTGTFLMEGGVFWALRSLFVGEQGRGHVVQRGGALVVFDELSVGHGSSGVGTFRMDGGNLWSESTKVGDHGEGSFEHWGGTHETGSLTVGSAAPGSYLLRGTGELRAGSEYIGYVATGTFTQRGGANRVTDLYVGGPELLPFLAPGKGTYSLRQGTLSARDVTVGWDGEGEFSQRGGEASLSGTLHLGRNPGSNGAYTLRGGTLETESVVVGNAGTGSFDHRDGTNNLRSSLILGLSGEGSYTLSSPGTLSAQDEIIGFGGQGNFIHRSGTNDVGDSLFLGKDPGGRGVYRLSSGTLTAHHERIGENGSGYFIQTGGENRVTGSLGLACGDSSSGEYRLNGGSLVSASLKVGANGIFTQRGGIFRTGPLTNFGEVNLRAGTVEVSGDIANKRSGRLNIFHDVTFPGNTTNEGTIKTTGATVTWGGTFTNHGAYISDPSRQTFNNLVVGESGYLVGYSQDLFTILGDLEIHSTQNQLWNTDRAILKFMTAYQSDELNPGLHNFWIPGEDWGPVSGAGNFRWGTLIVEGVTVNLLDGNPQNQGSALYVGKIQGLQIDQENLTILNIYGAAGFNLYYQPSLNPELQGLTYRLSGQAGGWLLPIGLQGPTGPGGNLTDSQVSLAVAQTPVPASILLLGSGLLGLGLLGRRRLRR